MIDYFLIDEKKIRERAQSVPKTIEVLLNSENTQKTVQRIAREHFLDEERTTTLSQLTGLVLLGFVSLEDLAHEISENLPLNQVHSRQLTEDLKAAIFEPIKRDLERVYEPVSRFETKEFVPVPEKKEFIADEKTPLEKIGQEGIKTAIKIEVREKEPPIEGAPLIIHKEDSMPAPVQTEKKSFKGLEFPFGFFGKESKSAPSEPVKVRVEGPTSRSKELHVKKEEKKVVHYSELRTPLTPFQKAGDEIINLETFDRKPAGVIIPIPEEEPAKEVPIKPVAETTRLPIETDPGPPKNSPEPKPEPKIEGNIVDLRQ
ncbi:MAG TPA: hypothetical protein VNK70_02055 [Candidatus Paceibacterota bacterium]|nr:hypothetical protein [Candidatus Paceibacterota bacterium]